MESDPSIKVLPPVLTTQEVSELLNLNVRTVLAMAQDGRLPAHRLPGSRKIQYLTTEILATVARCSLAESANGQQAESPVAERMTRAEVDPCDVWCAAPTRGAEDSPRGYVLHWIELARKAGLSPIDVTSAHLGPVAGCHQVGAVDIDGLVYEVRVGQRQRTRYVDDDGEERWGLIETVWVEPLPLPESAGPGETPPNLRCQVSR